MLYQIANFIVVYQLTVNCFYMLLLDAQKEYSSISWQIVCIIISACVAAIALWSISFLSTLFPIQESNVFLWRAIGGIVCATVQIIIWALVLPVKKTMMLQGFFLISIGSCVLLTVILSI